MPRRRGISPVIATVIIVAVTIAVAIAVAFWMTGIIGLFTGFEQLQITSIYDDGTGIYVAAKNTGTQTASIVDVYLNGKPCVQLGACDVYNVTKTSTNPPKLGADTKSFALRPGDTITLKITNIKTEQVGQTDPGVSVEVKLVTASGKEYPKLIVLQEFKAGVERVSAIAPTPSYSDGAWTFSFTIKNDGAATVTITEIVFNETTVARFENNRWSTVDNKCPALDESKIEFNPSNTIDPDYHATVSLELQRGKQCLGKDLEPGTKIVIWLRSSRGAMYLVGTVELESKQ